MPLLSLIAEINRRNEEWDAAPVRALIANNDPVAAGFAALLLRDGSAKIPATLPRGKHSKHASWRCHRWIAMARCVPLSKLP